MSQLSFCVHGHFYQPSREDPLTGEIPEERGAYPYKNWNELIFNHCYFPNAELGNFKKISFNIGPTLMNWMEDFHPEVLSDIVSQDMENYQKYGVGNALAQPYHHTILPLASREDKISQIKWGIEDFKHRFGHLPTGMWLPETAVDLETLDIMVDNGIEFTILAPWQADSASLDISQPYWVKTSANKKIAVFFYHKDLSTQISFNPLTTINADVFATNFIMPNLSFGETSNKPRYLLLASDGELYGHHQPFRDKFLAHLMNGSLKNRNIQQTFPGLWLQRNPPTEFIKIKDKTSWSCHHGVLRWSYGCDCTPQSEWKNHLWNFINSVSNIVNQEYIKNLTVLTQEIWDIRHEFIQVLLDKVNITDFLYQKLGNQILKVDVDKLVNLFSAQYERQRMFTSCGWFFEDFDRIEPQYILSYAAHALYSTQKVSGQDYLTDLKPMLNKIRSNKSQVNAEELFIKYLERARVEDPKEELRI